MGCLSLSSRLRRAELAAADEEGVVREGIEVEEHEGGGSVRSLLVAVMAHGAALAGAEEVEDVVVGIVAVERNDDANAEMGDD